MNSEDLNKSNQAVGALCGITLVSILLTFWPPKFPSAQVLSKGPSAAPAQPLSVVVDSLAQDNDRRDSLNVVLARDVLKQAQKKLREQRRLKQATKHRLPESIKPMPGIALISTDSVVYEVPAQYYAGIAIIDPQDLPVDLMIIEPMPSVEFQVQERPGLLKRVAHFLTKPFKKHDQE